jgi:DNA helicase-2/ATP-dependent DNA helicase PcrA
LGLSKDFTIYDDQDQLALVKRVLRDLGLDEKRYQPKAMAGRINRAKQEVQGPAQGNGRADQPCQARSPGACRHRDA